MQCMSHRRNAAGTVWVQGHCPAAHHRQQYELWPAKLTVSVRSVMNERIQSVAVPRSHGHRTQTEDGPAESRGRPCRTQQIN